MMTSIPASAPRTEAQPRTLAAALAAFALGAFLFAAVGFASPNAIHAATHDTRHAFALPCH